MPSGANLITIQKNLIPIVSAPAIPVNTSGLLRYYDAGIAASYPGTGTTWTDMVGSGYNLTLTNGPTFTSNGAGSYFTFDGTDDVATGTDTGLPTGANDRTISFWVYRLDTTAYDAFYGYGAATPEQSFASYTVNSTQYEQGYFNYSFAPPQSIPLNEWKLLTFTLSGGTSFVYYSQGSSVASGTQGSPAVNTVLNGVLEIAHANGGLGYLNARFGKWMIYNRALSGAEVLSNFNATKADYGL
jgi:hypothetical protein